MTAKGSKKKICKVGCPHEGAGVLKDNVEFARRRVIEDLLNASEKDERVACAGIGARIGNREAGRDEFSPGSSDSRAGRGEAS